MNSDTIALMADMLESLTRYVEKQNKINEILRGMVANLNERTEALETELANRLEEERVNSLHLEDGPHDY